MSATAPRLSSPLFALLAVVTVIAAACRPVSRAVVTQAPASGPAPTRANASPTAPAATQAATTAPTRAAARPTATAKPTLAETAAASPAPATPSATELSQAVPVPLGEPQRAGELEIVALKVEQQDLIGSAQPPAGHHFELVTVKVTNTGSAQAIKFFPETFVLYDTAHDTSFVMDLAREVLDAPTVLSTVEIKPGDSLTGVIVYEVPDGSADWELKYQTNAAHLFWSLSG